MCGIVGYVGPQDATPILLEGLSRLEYRGYDSAGVAVCTRSGLKVRKAKGRVADLAANLPARFKGSPGIGHTRWATHGEPTEENAHPQVDAAQRIAIVHNGIIENADELRAKLQADGVEFASQTDTETVAHLVAKAFTDGAADLEQAVRQALRSVVGAYGLAIMDAEHPDRIVVARNGSPVLLGIGEKEMFVASDVAALIGYTRQVVYLDDGEMGVLTKDGYEVLDLNARRISKGVSRIDWSLDEIEKGGFDHFMLKEIFEQPQTIQNTMRGRLVVDEGFSKLGGLNLTREELQAINHVVITACGTSWHSGLIGGMYIEECARLHAEVEYASEFRYRNPIVDDRTLCVVISQSGETADTLAAMREAKRRGAKTLGLVNVVGSTIAREDNGGIYLHAGPEIGVASTKAFTSQVIALALLTLKLGRLRNMSLVAGKSLAEAMLALPDQIQSILDRAPEIEQLADRFKNATNFLYLGRGYNFPVALEGALKLKEISYIHAEGYPAAEMKHGPIALIDSEMPVVFVAPHDAVFEKVVSNIQEVKARGGKVICITSQPEPVLDGMIDHEIRIPQTIDMLYPVLTVIPLQLLAYYIAVKRGLNVDQPRNLAKSVTVE
jgi:glucosamine--fructose-6-phosphate aminotransferase (isomerizing)